MESLSLTISECVNSSHCTDIVDGCGDVLHRRMTEEEPEDVEHVVAVVGEGERVHYCVVVDDGKHQKNGGDVDDKAREAFSCGCGFVILGA